MRSTPVRERRGWTSRAWPGWRRRRRRWRRSWSAGHRRRRHHPRRKRAAPPGVDVINQFGPYFTGRTESGPAKGLHFEYGFGRYLVPLKAGLQVFDKTLQ
jgi:hypothetical protein